MGSERSTSCSAAVVLAYLMEAFQLGLSDALSVVRRQRATVQLNPNFMDQLSRRYWEHPSIPIEVRQCLTGELLCTVLAETSWTTQHVKAAIEGSTGIWEREQRLLLGDAEFDDRVFSGLARDAVVGRLETFVISLARMVLDPWEFLEAGILSIIRDQCGRHADCSPSFRQLKRDLMAGRAVWMSVCGMFGGLTISQVDGDEARELGILENEAGQTHPILKVVSSSRMDDRVQWHYIVTTDGVKSKMMHTFY